MTKFVTLLSSNTTVDSENKPRGLFFKGPFWGAYFSRGLYSEELIYGLAHSWKQIYRFALFFFVFAGNFQVQAPGGLIFGGAI